MKIIRTISLATLFAIASLAIAAPGALIDERADRIGSAIEASIQRGEMAGAVALVVLDDETVYHEAFGYADIAARKPMRTDTIFRIASMTKAITSVGVMILYEQGHFRLNDPVADFIPEFAEMSVIDKVDDQGKPASTVPATRPIRIIDLLAHTSGISYPFEPGKLQAAYKDAGIIDGMTASNTLLEDQMKLLAQQPLLFEPGSAFAYGLNTDLLGYLIEIVSGMPLDEFIATSITGPLGMDDTYFYLPDDKADRLATLYAWVEGHGLVASKGDESSIELDDPEYPITGARSYFSGGGGLSSTAGDYARFLRMLANNGTLGGVRLMSRKSVELMRTARVDWNDDGQADFGLGFEVIGDLGQYGELGTEGSYSWGGAFHTSFWVDPEENLVAVLMSQTRPAKSKIDEHFKTLVYQALE